jgi:ADP-ribosyl-[dinitrogen reductase] hydrolase
MKGSCHCGAVTYEVDRLDSLGHCHCVTCRKTHAAAYATTGRVAREHFRWTHGAHGLTAYESSPGKRRYFCARCGSQLVAMRDGSDYVMLRAATLDDDPGIRPTRSIWRAHDVPWLAEPADLPQYDEWPREPPAPR